MENPRTADEVIRSLASAFRVITLGGIAVISHGLNRNTFDADVWLDPTTGASEWASRLGPFLFSSGSAYPVRIGSWARFGLGQLSDVINQDGVIRVLGLDRPLDIFRAPNELPIEEFDDVWERGLPLADGTRIPDVIDLLVTKQDTGRDKDALDVAFLEAKAEREYLAALPDASGEKACAMLARFLTPKVAAVAAHHAEAQVRDLGKRFLSELAEAGDPFARDLLTGLNS